MISIIKMLLSLVTWFTSRLSEQEQQAIGRDREVLRSLSTLQTQVKKAKQIDEAADNLTVDDIDRILHKDYRD